MVLNYYIHDPIFRRAYADLRESLAAVVDPRKADAEIARLLARYAEGPGDAVVGPRFEAVLDLLSERGRPVRSRRPDAPSGEPLAPLLIDGLRTHLESFLERIDVLDPWAGAGGLLRALPNPARAHACEADPARFSLLAPAFPNVCLADPFRLPDRLPTPGFLFTDDENTERIARQQAMAFGAILTDFRGATRPDARARGRVRSLYGKGLAPLRWATDRLAPQGVIAFLSDGAYFDEPTFAGMRATLAREFALVAHLALADGLALTWLVRAPGPCRILYARTDAPPVSFAEIGWTEREPTETHVWRTEILRPEWAGFLPIARERGAIFTEASEGVPKGRDGATPGAKGTRRIARRPFASVWRAFDRKALRAPMPAEGPTIVLLGEPFGVVPTGLPVDRGFGGPGATALAVGGRVAPAALRRFRVAYGAGTNERDVFDAVLALLHHPEYATRYREDLRRSVARVPLPDPEALAPLRDAPGAPSVGPGAAFGTGWLDPERFEPGVLPEYDDPFASPYARADVDPGFLLLGALGAALTLLRRDVTRVLPDPELTIEDAAEDRIGRWTALRWVTAADPENPDLARRTIAASHEVQRLVGILRRVEL